MDSKKASQVTTGLVVVAVGLMLLASQYDSNWAWDFGRLWPGVFVVLGVGRLLTRDGLGSGLWFMALAAIFFMHTYGVMRLNRSWPLFIVLAGVSMLFPKATCEGKRVQS